MVNVEGASNIEISASVFEEVEGLEVHFALVETFNVRFCTLMEWCEVIGVKSVVDIIGGGDAEVLFMEFQDLCLGLGCREHAVDFVVEARLAGVLGPGGEFLA